MNLAPVSTTDELSREIKELLWEIFTHDGWPVIESRIAEILQEQEFKVIDAARNSENDRYEVGRYDGSRGVFDALRELRDRCR